MVKKHWCGVWVYLVYGWYVGLGSVCGVLHCTGVGVLCDLGYWFRCGVRYGYDGVGLCL